MQQKSGLQGQEGVAYGSCKIDIFDFNKEIEYWIVSLAEYFFLYVLMLYCNNFPYML